MPTRVLNGLYREVWTETTPVTGAVSITTAIPLRNAVELSAMKATVEITAKYGTPAVSNPTFTLVGGVAIVAFTITGASDAVTYRIDIIRIHSVQQADDATYAGTGCVIDGAAVSSPVPPTGIVRYYVDAATGTDGAAGTSWATAWRTLAYATARLSSAAENATAARFIMRLRGTFGATDDLLFSKNLIGSTEVIIACDYTDCTVVQTGTVTATGAAPAAAHNMLNATLGGGIVLTTADRGRWIQFRNAVAPGGPFVCTYSITQVDAVNNYAWLSAAAGETPAWLDNNCTVTIFESGAVVQGSVSVSGPGSIVEPDRIRLSLLFLRAYKSGIANGDSLSVCDLRDAAGTGQQLTCGAGSTLVTMTYSPGVGDYCAPIQSAVAELGYCTEADPWYQAGSRGGDATCLRGGRLWLMGYFSGQAWTYAGEIIPYRAYIGALASRHFAYILGMGVIISGTGSYRPIEIDKQAAVDITNVSFQDLPVNGWASGMIRVTNGNLRFSSGSVDGNNTKAAATTTHYALYAYNSEIYFASGSDVSGFKGKSGFMFIIGGKVGIAADQTRGVEEGSGPDYTFNGADVTISANIVKSATNPSGGGTKNLFLDAKGACRITQTSGNFTLATPGGAPGAWTTDYAATYGAMRIRDGSTVRLGTLSGGAGGTTGVGCRVEAGSQLVHAGGGLSGAGPLQNGGLAAGAWPVAAQTDGAAVTPEGTLVYANKAL